LLFNTPKPNLKIPKENVLGFLWEPKSSRNIISYQPYARKHIGCYVVADTRNLGKPYQEYFSFMANFQNYNATITKKHPMCIVAID